MKITSKLLMITFENEVSLANDSIKVTLQHQAYVSEGANGDLHVDIEFTDIVDTHFLGVKLPMGYDNWKKFKETMSGLGINVDEMIDKASDELITPQVISAMKSEYKKVTTSIIK